MSRDVIVDGDDDVADRDKVVGRFEVQDALTGRGHVVDER
jgi:hypothetical protein